MSHRATFSFLFVPGRFGKYGSSTGTLLPGIEVKSEQYESSIWTPFGTS